MTNETVVIKKVSDIPFYTQLTGMVVGLELHATVNDDKDGFYTQTKNVSHSKREKEQNGQSSPIFLLTFYKSMSL